MIDALAEYAAWAAWAAKIMQGKPHLDAEALEAVNFALERTSSEKQKEMRKLKP